ncbi:MAG: hypothetical protein JW993_00400 [Sedimentisphaerales bacterium]|nr:hypothetical protein [Sedimentisphaerales bacterium]
MRLSAAIVLLGAMAVASVSGQSAPARRLIVEVRNGTPDGATVVGDQVTMQLYRGSSPLQVLDAVVGEDGKAVFDNLPADPGLTAVARARHQNMAFGGRPVRLSPAGQTTAQVTVYDVSTDASGLSIGTHHIIIACQPAGLEVTEYLQLENASRMAVIGSRRDAQSRPIVVEMDLPEGFTSLRALDYFEQQALVTTATGFYDTMAMPPGEHQATIAYQVGIERSPVRIARRIALPTSELLVFWKGGQGTLEGLGEPAGELVNAEGVPMKYYKRENLAAGDDIRFQITGINVRSSDTRMWIILGAVFAVVAAIAILRLRSGSPQGPSSS